MHPGSTQPLVKPRAGYGPLTERQRASRESRETEVEVAPGEAGEGERQQGKLLDGLACDEYGKKVHKEQRDFSQPFGPT